MKKIAILAALPVMLGAAACGDRVDSSDSAAVEAEPVTPVVAAPVEDNPAAGSESGDDTGEQSEMLDETVEDAEEQGDSAEDANDVEAGQLEAETEAVPENPDVAD